jgi:hypothetical protein
MQAKTSKKGRLGFKTSNPYPYYIVIIIYIIINIKPLSPAGLLTGYYLIWLRGRARPGLLSDMVRENFPFPGYYLIWFVRISPSGAII